MTDQEAIALYGAQIRMQVALSALQALLYTANDVAADATLDPEQAAGFAKARQDAATAIEILHGGEHTVPASLTRNWRDRQMVRDASRVLADSAA
jgi:hypothetical protein